MKQINASPVKLTKSQAEEARTMGITHAKMTSRKVNKRMLRAVEKFKIKEQRAISKKQQEDKKFDQFLNKQNINIASKKFDDFEKEVQSLAEGAKVQAPLGETFPETSHVRSLEYVEAIGEAVSVERVYNHETGDFDPVEPENNVDAQADAPTTHVFTSGHGGRGKAIPIATVFETMPEPAEDCTTIAQIAAKADQHSDAAPDHSFQLPA